MRWTGRRSLRMWRPGAAKRAVGAEPTDRDDAQAAVVDRTGACVYKISEDRLDGDAAERCEIQEVGGVRSEIGEQRNELIGAGADRGVAPGVLQTGEHVLLLLSSIGMPPVSPVSCTSS